MNIPIKDGTLEYYPYFINEVESNTLFATFKESLKWQQDRITIYGKTHDVPRLQAWYGDKDSSYSYSGIKLIPNPWTDELENIKDTIELATGKAFNSVLANLYRTGNDSNGWHADNERELGVNPVIASISLGQVRKFKIKHKQDKTLKKDLLLGHGSLLVMSGPMQHNWLHTIAKTKKQIGERINLTFRLVNPGL